MIRSAALILIDLKPILQGVVAAAREAGSLLLEEFHREGGPRGEHGSAEIDKEMEDLLKQRLQALIPCGWLGEETGIVAEGEGLAWVVNPHDGTGAFLDGRRGSSVSIALIRDGRPVLGVVHAFAMPPRGDTIAWAEGCGPVQRNGIAVPTDLRAGRLDKAQVVALSYVASQLPDVNAGLVQPARFIAMPSIAYRLALAAVGDVVAAVALNPLRAWDFAAGHALLRGAGGALVDEQGREITYDAHGRASTKRCFGGAPAAVDSLVPRPWSKAMVPDPGDSRPARPAIRVRQAYLLDRAQGCLLGQVAGDALGALVEFQTQDEIASRFPGGPSQLADGGPWNIIAGQCTDDSEMALALARSLVREQSFAAEAVFDAYGDWRQSGPFDIGQTTSAALTRTYGPVATAQAGSQANGSLMRVSPIGIFAAGDPARAARLAAADSALTHAHPVCIAACSSFAAAIAVGVASGRRDDMLDAADAHAGSGADADIVRARLAAAGTMLPANFQDQMGWVLTAYQNAFYRLAIGRTAERGVVETVACGGDTDTNGAIVGALLGAAEGGSALPRQWVSMIMSCRPLRSTGARRARPRRFWPDDIMDLAEGLLVAGGVR
ncbi:inositol monophosphatase family protein [Lichenihabitans psoromatis]|uniref:inositol monophosphatase family protein n=1 Tax=Lichenihabitans psoromatis TaxID=2528642 RepID=UPI00103629E5|nr:inositol monophosphatase family protein [Lichenihabitans psoromatis]